MEIAEYHLGVEDELVLLSQAAKEAGLSAERLRQLIVADELPAQRFAGRYWVIRRSDLEAFKRKGRPKPGRPPGTGRPKST